MQKATSTETSVALPLQNTFTLLTKEKKLRVIVVGNSVTAGSPVDSRPGSVPSFYITLEKWLKETFPQAKIEVIPKIIYAIGPEVQLFRMDERVIAEKPDLVLAEFGAANGAWGDKGRNITEPATEGYVRRLRMLLPETDCVLVLGIFKTMLDDYEKGKVPASAAFLQEIGNHYGCAMADVQKEIAGRVLKGDPWETYMNDFIHPNDHGYRIYGDILVDVFERQWNLYQEQSGKESGVVSHSIPRQTRTSRAWVCPKLIPAKAAQTYNGFEEREHGKWETLLAISPEAHGKFVPPPSVKIVGMLMRSSGNCGNLEVQYGAKWLRLARKSEPHFTECDDPENKLFRSFFAANGLPSEMDEVNFRVSPIPENAEGLTVEIVGFFSIKF